MKKVRELGGSSIAIPGMGVSMSINIGGDCRVELRVRRRDKSEALRVYEELRRAGYEPTRRITGKRHEVVITHTEIRDDPRLKEPVCQKLSEWLKREKDEKRRERIIMAMQNLMCPNASQFALKNAKRFRSSLINVPGTNINMTVHITGKYNVELQIKRRDKNEALRLVEELEKAGYNPSIYVVDENHVVSITHVNVRDSPLKPVVCQKLSEWLNEINDEKMGKKITAAMQNLKCLDND